MTRQCESCKLLKKSNPALTFRKCRKCKKVLCGHCATGHQCKPLTFDINRCDAEVDRKGHVGAHRGSESPTRIGLPADLPPDHSGLCSLDVRFSYNSIP